MEKEEKKTNNWFELIRLLSRFLLEDYAKSAPI